MLAPTSSGSTTAKTVFQTVVTLSECLGEGLNLSEHAGRRNGEKGKSCSFGAGGVTGPCSSVLHFTCSLNETKTAGALNCPVCMCDLLVFFSPRLVLGEKRTGDVKVLEFSHSGWFP